MIILKNINQLITPLGKTSLKGEKMNQIQEYKNAQIVIENGVFVYVGQNTDKFDEKKYRVIDCSSNAVIPSFIDSHTHLVFSSFREREFIDRVNGLSYMEIMNKGGGIASSVKKTREASEQELFDKAMSDIQELKKFGITSIEIKSGYGLDKETELKQLRVIQRLKKESGLDIVSTFMGAHSIPQEYKGKNREYIEYIINEILPIIKEENLAEFVDIFCEKGVFSFEESKLLLVEAQKRGFKAKIHADEIVSTKGAELASEINCISADHLLHISENGIKALADSDCIATLLPLTAFCLREPYANARKLIDSGTAVALATDFNPGSCFSYSIPLLIAIAVIYMKMSIKEVISALTINAASAINLQKTHGSIEQGKIADLIILKYPSADFLAYHSGINIVKNVIKRGEIIV